MLWRRPAIVVGATLVALGTAMVDGLLSLFTWLKFVHFADSDKLWTLTVSFLARWAFLVLFGLAAAVLIWRHRPRKNTDLTIIALYLGVFGASGVLQSVLWSRYQILFYKSWSVGSLVVHVLSSLILLVCGEWLRRRPGSLKVIAWVVLPSVTPVFFGAIDMLMRRAEFRLSPLGVTGFAVHRLSFVALALFFVWFAYYRARFRFDDGPACMACGYNLTGNTSGVCPECGAWLRSLGSCGFD